MVDKSRVRQAESHIMSAEEALEMSKESYRLAMQRDVEPGRREALLHEAKEMAELARKLTRRAASKVQYK